MFHDDPETVSMHGVKSVLKVYEVQIYYYLRLPFMWLLSDVSEFEDLVWCSSECSVSCFFFPKTAIDSWFDPVY